MRCANGISFGSFFIPCLIIFGCFLSLDLQATVWQVGPTRTYTKPSQVATLVGNGDTIEIDAGLYLGDVARWVAHNLYFKGVGSSRAHLDANGLNADGKAIWVMKGNNCVVENIEFSGCKVPDQNGAGIRQEGRDLTLRNCYFHHNEMGILTNNDGVSSYVFEGCEFAFNGYGDGYSHNIYVGKVQRLTMRNCYSHDSSVGHLVKSRAQENYLYYNRFTTESGDGSYEVDLPNGGLAVLIGNIIEQGAASQNGGIVAFGLEGISNTQKTIVLSHNTIVNNRFDGRFVQYAAQTELVKMTGNLLVGPGTTIQGSGAVIDSTHNLRLTSVASAMFEDAATFNFRPLPASPAIDGGEQNPGTFQNISLAPDSAYQHPLTLVDRITVGQRPDIGALELPGVSNTETPLSDEDALVVYPNPFTDRFFLKNVAQDARVKMFNSAGVLVYEGAQVGKHDFSALPAGQYWLVVGDKKVIGLVKM